MATTIASIHIGQGDMWLGGTAPTGGAVATDPLSSSVNVMTSLFAAPASGGTAVGFTNGPATLTYKPTYYNVETEQAFAEVLVVPTAEECTLDFVMLEASYNNLNKAMGQATSEVNVTGAQFNANFVGGKPTVNTFLAALCSRKRTAVGYYLLTIYQVYSMDGVALNFERRKETQNKVNMRALADVTRPTGDQLFQLVEYTANPA